MINTSHDKLHNIKSKLSPRLKSILMWFPEGGDSRIVDVGCDHGQLGIYCLRNGFAASVLNIDKRKEPLRRAEEYVKKFGYSSSVTFYCQNGIGNIQLYDKDVVVIAGMGGLEISDILKSVPIENLALPQKWIIHPTRSDETVRQTLVDLGFKILDEIAVEEEYRVYPIILAEYNILKTEESLQYNDSTLNDFEIFAGPVLIKKYFLEPFNSTLLKYFINKLEFCRDISNNPDKKLKYNSFIHHIERMLSDDRS